MVLLFKLRLSPLLSSGNGQLIRPSDLTLGGCAALDTAGHVLQFRAELQGCGSTVTVRGLPRRPSTLVRTLESL